MSTERLTSLTAVKQWLNISSTESDSFLTRLIDAASQFVLEYINWESFQLVEYTYRFRGSGSHKILLQNWPVVEVSQVSSGGQVIPASVFTNGMPTPGYYVSENRQGPQSLELTGYGFPRGLPAEIIYEAGFRTSVPFIPTTGNLTITPGNGGTWSKGVSVTINGAEATLVLADPATDQYTLSEWGQYGFSAEDIDAPVVITYDYTPFSVSHACTELVGEWVRRKDRIGIVSKSLGGQETVSFSQSDMSSAVKSMLQPFKNVVPV